MLWLLERPDVAGGIVDGCRLTKALDEPGAMETPHQRILYAMPGMVLGGDYDLLRDLRQHAKAPDCFEPISDSHLGHCSAQSQTEP